MLTKMRSVLLVLVGVGLGLIPSTSRAAAPAVVYSPPGKYYLSLGDSLAFGYEPNNPMAATQGAAAYATGYTDDFAKMLTAIDPSIQVVNLGCSSSPGETTSSFLTGCRNSAGTHVSYSTSQLDAALAFLAAHPGQVSPITLSVGANDIVQMIQTCGGIANLKCVAGNLPATLQTLGKNLARIVVALRTAAPHAEIIVNQPYNPFGAIDPSTNVFVPALNGVMSQAAAAGGAVYVDWFTAININRASDACELLNICANGDIHPTDAGYLVMAQADWDAAGYNALLQGFMTSFSSTSPGNGQVLFGSGPGCLGLVQTATRDLGAGTRLHIIPVTGNDLPGTVGNVGIQGGTSYSYEFANVAMTGTALLNNGGKCYSVTPSFALPGS